MKYLYSFSAWPSETWGFKPALFALFRTLSARVELAFTEWEFERFRSTLNHDGITLREIERVPYHDPEAVP